MDMIGLDRAGLQSRHKRPIVNWALAPEEMTLPPIATHSASSSKVMQYDEATISSAKSVAESFRDVVQGLLVPELKAVKVSVESVHSEAAYLRTEMKLRDEKMEQTDPSWRRKNEQAVRNMTQKLDEAIEIRERLASIEARLPRQ